MRCERKELLLYAVTDRRWLDGADLLSQVEAALRGGVTCVQFREKELHDGELLSEAVKIRELCRKYRAPFIMNDYVDIAVEIDADGVHLGQKDMEVGEARRKLGADKIIGVSARTVEQALLAEKRGADYLGVGAAFPTGSKSDANVISHDTLKAICDAVSIPVVAIGGIHKNNVLKLSGKGIAGIAVISAIFAQPDIESAAEELAALAKKITGNTRPKVKFHPGIVS